MTPERWKRVEELYHTARARPAGARASFLAGACPDDEALRREVQALLNERVSADGSLAELALPMAAHGVSDVAPAPMTGRRLGGYHLQTLIGAGGMGEVYRARDATLGRDVAIKILPLAFTKDPNRLARFEREARMLAALNHPNICAIYGLEEVDPSAGSGQAAVRFLILELVDGETLAERIARTVGGLPLADALAIARQIADALEVAHEKGIVHRDLKPANIKITADGVVKVLDLGLAKAVITDASGPDLTQPPTVTIGGTSEGVILGTAAYMSPEQARGKVVDKRTDIWAFGCVLYEMLTGRVTFNAETVSDTIGKILEREPAWETLPAATPPGVTRLLRRCLEKEPKRRLRDIGDARLEIDDARGAGTQQNEPVAEVRSGRRERLAWASALALVALVAAVSGARALRPAPTASEVSLDINTPPTRDPSLAISPDGLKIVFVAQSAGQSQLWLRTLASPPARPLAETERATRPFWSPDSRSIGFFADSKLKRMDIDGGSMKTLMSDAPVGLGGAWNSDGTIVFSTNPGRPILRISAEGGEFSATTRFESPRHRTHSFPRFLPDGRHFLFFVSSSSPETRGVYIGQIDGLDTRRLFDAAAPAVYAATGHLLFIREGKLLAQGFDPDRLELRGAPSQIAEHVTGQTTLSASAAGPIAYRTPSADSGQRQLVWVDRTGREFDKEVYLDSSGLGPSLSRDGRRVAVSRIRDGNRDIWVYERARRTWDPVTVDSGDDLFPLWSPDHTRMVFGSNRNADRQNLYRKLLGAPSGSEELLLKTPQAKFPMDWSADGRFLLYDSLDRGRDIWALPLEGDPKPFEVVQTDSDERVAQFSPDGTWIAYQSNKSGRFEIYVQPFPGPGDASRVSTDGGAQVRWNPKGGELFYVAADDRLMAVPIRFVSNGKAVEPGPPRGLFATNVGSTVLDQNRQQYAVSPDGQSFMMNSVLGEASTSPITVILNWKPNR